VLTNNLLFRSGASEQFICNFEKWNSPHFILNVSSRIHFKFRTSCLSLPLSIWRSKDFFCIKSPCCFLIHVADTVHTREYKLQWKHLLFGFTYDNEGTIARVTTYKNYMAVAFLIKLTICCVVRFDVYIIIHTPYAQPKSTKPCTSPLPLMSCVLLTHQKLFCSPLITS
jgi:hypothetical protein